MNEMLPPDIDMFFGWLDNTWRADRLCTLEFRLCYYLYVTSARRSVGLVCSYYVSLSPHTGLDGPVCPECYKASLQTLHALYHSFLKF